MFLSAPFHANRDGTSVVWVWFSRVKWVRLFGNKLGWIWDDLSLDRPAHEARRKDGVLEILLEQEMHIHPSSGSTSANNVTTSFYSNAYELFSVSDPPAY
jgi:hypothetical protein